MNQLGQKVSTSMGAALLISMAVFSLVIIFYFIDKTEALVLSVSSANSFTDVENDFSACTKEAKICPSGSTVKRSGPDCKFAPCPEEDSQKSIVGGDQDEHGCIGSAGYSWCEVKQKCLRVWEEKCEN